MLPDKVASSITLGNFTAGPTYRSKKSDMTDSSPTAMKSGQLVAHIKRFIG